MNDEKENGVELSDEQLDGVAGGGPLVLRKTPPQKEDRDTSGDGRTGRVGALLR
jgi:hypothetical protein